MNRKQKGHSECTTAIGVFADAHVPPAALDDVLQRVLA